MNSTTSATETETTPALPPLIVLLSYIRIPSITTQFYLWGYLVTFLLGFVGNTLSFLTFLRPILRGVSTGCLFLLLATTDTLYLLIAVIDFVEFGLQVRLYLRVDYDALCRFRAFTICVAQLYSAWILVIITMDRWIRTRFPFKANAWCTPKNALRVAGLLLVFDVGLNAHMLSPFFGLLLPGVPHVACGSNFGSASYFAFYVYQWTIIQFVTTSFGPGALMILMVIDIFIIIRTRKRAVTHGAQVHHADQVAGRDKRLQNQMIFLMLSSIGIFFVTTLPLTIGHIQSVHVDLATVDLAKLLTTLTILNWLQSLNCAINFYVHCLTSTLFRREFIQRVTGARGGHRPATIATKQTRTIAVVPEARQ